MSAALLPAPEFAGKYAFVRADSYLLIGLAAQHGTLVLTAGNPNDPAPALWFNLYGSLHEGFTLQGPNWLYVGFGVGYAADKPRGDAACSVFRLVDDPRTGTTCLVEVAGPSSYYVVAGADNSLARVPLSGPVPEAAQFTLAQVTLSLTAMKAKKSTLGNPLTGVYLAGQPGLDAINFASSDVSYANFSGAQLRHTNFNGVVATQAVFDESLLAYWVASGTFTNCSFVNTDLQHANLAGAVFKGCTLSKSNFTGAVLQQCDFSGATIVSGNFRLAKVNQATFRNAVLTNADFSAALGVKDIISFEGAILLGTNLKKQDLRTVALNQATLFLNALLDDCDFRGHDLTNVVFGRASLRRAKFDNTILNGTQFAFANLSLASLTGGVSMTGANLSNANLQGTNMPGAQLGAKQTLFPLPLTDAPLLDQRQIPEALRQGLHLSAQAQVEVLLAGYGWRVLDGLNSYSINNNSYQLLVQQLSTTNAAVLTNAYMYQTNLQQANLYAVEMSGVNWSGGAASALGADLGQANLSNSFLVNMNFKQCLLQGASFDYAVLITAVFDGADLSPSPTLKPTSFAFASLQGTRFLSPSRLYSTNLTNAAVALPGGVPLFTLDSGLAATLDAGIVSEALRKAFSDVVYPLIPAATIKVTTPGAAWTIANRNEQDPTQTGYANFSLVLVTQLNGLQFIQVSGASPLLVLSAMANGGRIQLPVNFDATGITPDQLNGDTTCPSGMKYRYRSLYLTYEALMTPALPPPPPICLDC